MIYNTVECISFSRLRSQGNGLSCSRCIFICCDRTVRLILNGNTIRFQGCLDTGHTFQVLRIIVRSLVYNFSVDHCDIVCIYCKFITEVCKKREAERIVVIVFKFTCVSLVVISRIEPPCGESIPVLAKVGRVFCIVRNCNLRRICLSVPRYALTCCHCRCSGIGRSDRNLS